MDRETIEEVFNIINNLSISTSLSSFQDGRVASILDEDTLKEEIKNICEKNNLEFQNMPPRAWCDFKINGTPFNLKEGSGKTADNLSSKKGLIYALTGVEIKDIISHEKAIDTILFNPFNDDSDYGIIFFNKNTQTFKVSSLKNIDINLLIPNGSNLPFQIKLGKLDDVLDHSSKNQNVELLKKYLESIKKHNIDFSTLECIISKEENDGIEE